MTLIEKQRVSKANSGDGENDAIPHASLLSRLGKALTGPFRIRLFRLYLVIFVRTIAIVVFSMTHYTALLCMGKL